MGLSKHNHAAWSIFTYHAPQSWCWQLARLLAEQPVSLVLPDPTLHTCASHPSARCLQELQKANAKAASAKREAGAAAAQLAALEEQHAGLLAGIEAGLSLP